MKDLGARTVHDVLLLSLIAGSADAAGFLGPGHAFTSNMTGNVVLLGIALGQGHWVEAARVFYVVLIFMAGIALGAWLCRSAADPEQRSLSRRAMAAETALLFLFAAVWWTLTHDARDIMNDILIALLALALGIQAAAISRLKIPGVATTAITGTLTSLVNGALRPSATAPKEMPGMSPVRFQTLVVVLYCGGAIVSALLMHRMPSSVGLLPALLALVATLRQR